MLGNIIPGFKVFSTLLGLALFALLAWWVYSTWFAPPNDLTTPQRQCLEKILPKVAADVREFADRQGVYGVNVARFNGDTPNAQITRAVRDIVAAQEGIYLHRASVSDGLRKVIQDALREDKEKDEEWLRVQGAEEARKYVTGNEGIGFVVFGTTELSKDGNQGSVKVRIWLQGATPEASFSGSYYQNTWDKTDDTGESWSSTGVGAGQFIGLLMIFLIVSFFLPIVTGPLALHGFKMESNLVNFGILAGYTLINGVLAWLLMGFATTILAVVLLLGAMVAGGLWNYRVCSVWERRA